MGQRLRVAGWLRFGSKTGLEKALRAFASLAAPEYYDESAWDVEGLDAHIAIDTELPGDFTGVEKPFIEMIRPAAFGYVDYFEEGNLEISASRGSTGPLKRWAVAHVDKKLKMIGPWGTMGLGYPKADETVLLSGAFDFADAKGAAAAIAAPIRLPYIADSGVRELRLAGKALALAGARLKVEAAITGPWEQLQEPLIEALMALSIKASSGAVTVRGGAYNHEVSAKAKVAKSTTMAKATAPKGAARLAPVDPSATPAPAARPAPAAPAPAAAGKRGTKKAAAEAPFVMLDDQGPVQGARVLSDGRLFTWGGGKATFWSLPDVAPLHTFSLAAGGEGGGVWPIRGASEVPGGRVLVFHEMDGDVELLDGQSGELRRLKGHGQSVLGAASEGDLLLTWSRDCTFRTWSLDGEERRTFRAVDDGDASQVAPLGDGTFLVITSGPARRMRAATGEVVEELGALTAAHPIGRGRHVLEHYGEFKLRGGGALSFVLDKGNAHQVHPLGEGHVVIAAHADFHEVSLHDGSMRAIATGHTKDVKYLAALGGGLWATHGRSMPGLNERFGFDGRLKVWAEGAWTELSSYDAQVPIAQAIPLRGGRVALLLDDAVRGKEVPIIDARKGWLSTTVKGPKKAVLGALELPDGRLLVWAKDRSARIVSLAPA
jgi:hypothetical protein